MYIQTGANRVPLAALLALEELGSYLSSQNSQYAPFGIALRKVTACGQGLWGEYSFDPKEAQAAVSATPNSLAGSTERRWSLKHSAARDRRDRADPPKN